MAQGAESIGQSTWNSHAISVCNWNFFPSRQSTSSRPCCIIILCFITISNHNFYFTWYVFFEFILSWCVFQWYNLAFIIISGSGICNSETWRTFFARHVFLAPGLASIMQTHPTSCCSEVTTVVVSHVTQCTVCIRESVGCTTPKISN